MKRDFYPMITVNYVGRVGRRLSIFGLNDRFTYRVHEAKKIIYQADVHTNVLVNRFTPKKMGENFTIEYPDGSIVRDGSIVPDFNKLQSLSTHSVQNR